MSYTNVDMKAKRIIAILVCLIFLYWFVFGRRHYHIQDLTNDIFKTKPKLKTLKEATKQVEDIEKKTEFNQRKSLEKDIDKAQAENSLLTGKLDAVEKQLQNVRLQLEETETKLEVQKSETKKAENEQGRIPIPETYSFNGHRIVHFDMKGAPPSLDYLMSLFPILKRNGVTGFLIEYEDMFPFTGELEKLRSKNAYKPDALKKFIQTAREEMFLIIPLIQTFGHLEFVLKHKEFSHLRALHDRSDAVSPTKDESYTFVQSMIQQIIDFHTPGLKLLHLGGDEVWYLHNKSDAAQLYLDYMVPLLEHVRGLNLRIIIWEDMFRKWSIEDLEKIATLAEPMLWNYRSTLTLTNETIVNYKKAFKNVGVWLASAFKGAERPNTFAVNIKSRVDNHLAWVNLLPSLKPMKIQGFALTGWSRFNHRSGLCELLPNSLPSLIACLDVIKTGKFDERTMQYVSRELGFQTPILIDSDAVYGHKPNLQSGSFPGNKIYYLNEKLAEAQSNTIRVETLIQSWGSKYQQVRIGDIESNFLSYFVTKCKVTLDILRDVKRSVNKVFIGIFDEDTTHEWMADKVSPIIKNANRICRIVKTLVTPKYRVKSPKNEQPIKMVDVQTVDKNSKQKTDEIISSIHKDKIQTQESNELSTASPPMQEAFETDKFEIKSKRTDEEFPPLEEKQIKKLNLETKSGIEALPSPTEQLEENQQQTLEEIKNSLLTDPPPQLITNIKKSRSKLFLRKSTQNTDEETVYNKASKLMQRKHEKKLPELIDEDSIDAS